jgi:hypothetical protein
MLMARFDVTVLYIVQLMLHKHVDPQRGVFSGGGEAPAPTVAE